jgi:hypothetical protein
LTVPSFNAPDIDIELPIASLTHVPALTPAAGALISI